MKTSTQNPVLMAMKFCLKTLGMLAMALTFTVSAQAQNWPSKPIRMVIAFPPGGPTDIVSRVIAQQLSQQLGQSVIVDNKPGAGGNIAAELVAKAPADGYTVFYNTSAIVIGPALYGKVNYDTLNDFAPRSEEHTSELQSH